MQNEEFMLYKNGVYVGSIFNYLFAAFAWLNITNGKVLVFKNGHFIKEMTKTNIESLL